MENIKECSFRFQPKSIPMSTGSKKAGGVRIVPRRPKKSLLPGNRESRHDIFQFFLSVSHLSVAGKYAFIATHEQCLGSRLLGLSEVGGSSKLTPEQSKKPTLMYSCVSTYQGMQS